MESNAILAVDPGLSRCGIAYLSEEIGIDTDVVPPADAGRMIAAIKRGTVVIERPQSVGISNPDVLRTAELFGWLVSQVPCWAEVRGIYRREVLKALDVTGKGNRDTAVRARLIEMHGGSKQVAVGIKRSPGPLYGVRGDGWAALAVAYAAKHGAGHKLPDWMT